jgi:hypothetical protein
MKKWIKQFKEWLKKWGFLVGFYLLVIYIMIFVIVIFPQNFPMWINMLFLIPGIAGFVAMMI